MKSLRNYKITHLYIIGIFAIFLSSAFKIKPSEIYVSPNGNDKNAGTSSAPFRTIEKALDKVKIARKSNSDPQTIVLSEGDFYLTKPIHIGPELSNVTIKAKENLKVSIKGSAQLTLKWKVYKGNVWVADVPNMPDFNQLFIDGQQQILARYPNYDVNGGYWQGSSEDATSKARIATWKNPVGGFLHVMHNGRWGGFHYEITGVNPKGELILKGGQQNNRPSTMHPKLRMIENVFEELDSENEWYFDKKTKKLFVWKNTDVSKSTIEVSVLKHLIEIKGTEQNPVKNFNIEGIVFQHAQRTFMEHYVPLLRSDWTIYRGGAIFLDGTENCRISDCEFTLLGGNVIFVNAYNRNTQIIGNHIHHCGASAISLVGDTTAVRSPSYQYDEFVPISKMDTVRGPANNLYPSDCNVENNLIYTIGRVEKQVAGVQISMSMKVHVKNNSIYDVPRAGINVSEGTWGGHIIEYNDVFDTVLESSDHGSFNSWGRDRFWHPKREEMIKIVAEKTEMPYWDAIYPTIIRNNRFRCDHGWDIDLDDGSSNYQIYENLCLNRGIKLREGFGRLVENNIMVNNSFHPHVWFENSNDIFRKNIVMSKYADIRLLAWGKEVDYNLFPDSSSLALAQKNQTDQHSLFGDPMFVNPAIGDFSVNANSPALKVGFKNFAMDKFGVQKPKLKAIAKHPSFPLLINQDKQKSKVENIVWNGLSLKNIESIEEQSAFGTHNLDGAVLIKVAEDSRYQKSQIKEGDVIIRMENENIISAADFVEKYKKHSSIGEMSLVIIRNQKEINVLIK